MKKKYNILVNKKHLFKKEDVSNFTFETFQNCFGDTITLEKKTKEAYLKLKEELKKENIEIEVTSGKRSVEEQQELQSLYPKEYIAPPFASEHHTGLCFDILLVINGRKIESNEELLKQEDIFQKIHSKLASYGLILRYPKGKEEITGYPYEPWHFRFVLKNTAKIIEENHLTLEEYYEIYQRSGVLIIDKEEGVTSRDVVNKISKIFDTDKVGHNGTLDPLATGVLVVTINKATKINELLTATDKEYVVEVQVGIKTDTKDITGTVIEKKDCRVDEDALKEVFQSFPKEYEQEVPIYSAVKIKGKKLYEYARRKEKIELPKRKVFIKKLELIKVEPKNFTFLCQVSKGCYVRSLVNDIGERLGKPLTMSALRRTKQGRFEIEDAKKIEDITVNMKILKIEDVLGYKVIEVTPKIEKKIRNGGRIEDIYNIEDYVFFKKKEELIALYKKQGNQLIPYKMFL